MPVSYSHFPDNSLKERESETEASPDLSGSERINEEKSGGGGQSRTVDAADMGRVRIPPTNWKQVIKIFWL